jgi:hypothetical protein
MYIVPLKTAVVEALASVFVANPNTDFQGANKPLISIEYPVEQSHYPGIWVQFAEDGPVTIAGINHVEQSTDTVAHTVSDVGRWRFSGKVTLTIVALTSLERDRLYDEVVRIFIGARFNTALTPFRTKIETNDLIGINVSFDDFQPFGDATPQGTPWGTDEIIYEKSLSFDLIGEFLTDVLTTALVPLSLVEYLPYADGVQTPPAWT